MNEEAITKSRRSESSNEMGAPLKSEYKKWLHNTDEGQEEQEARDERLERLRHKWNRAQ